MTVQYPKVPQQPDGSSCGLFVVHFFKQILRQLECQVQLSSFFKDTSSWFNRQELYFLRNAAAECIAEKAKEQKNVNVDLTNIQLFPSKTEERNKRMKSSNYKSDSKKVERGTSQRTEHEGSSSHNEKISFKDYIQSIDENEEDYSLLWS